MYCISKTTHFPRFYYSSLRKCTEKPWPPDKMLHISDEMYSLLIIMNNIFPTWQIEESYQLICPLPKSSNQNPGFVTHFNYMYRAWIICVNQILKVMWYNVVIVGVYTVSLHPRIVLNMHEILAHRCQATSKQSIHLLLYM